VQPDLWKVASQRWGCGCPLPPRGATMFKSSVWGVFPSKQEPVHSRTKRNAMHRMGELQELTGAAIYLASPASAFVTGATLRVDGGYLVTGI